MKKLILFSTLFCFSAFAVDENSEFGLRVINQSAICSGSIQKKLDLGKVKIQKKLIRMKVEEIKECAAQYALNQLYQICQGINKNTEVEFASSPNFIDEGCSSTLLKIKGQDVLKFTCKIKAAVDCLTTTTL